MANQKMAFCRCELPAQGQKKILKLLLFFKQVLSLPQEKSWTLPVSSKGKPDR
jgi:hypothetical protein